jgi:BirA family biotin operon repressor/biotin-[acetyl-CoA-carboxylase] ligase
MSAPDHAIPLLAADLRAALGNCRIGNEIVVTEETTSTNDLVWEAHGKGVSDGFIAMAERQTAGRGQYGRHWHSSPYLGLWFSVLLRPKLTLAESPQLTSWLANAIALTIREQTGCVPFIKPPNDVFLLNRKVAGVLVEGRTEANGSYVAAAGIGINVNQTIDDFPEDLRSTAGSLALAAGHPVSRKRFAIALFKNLESVML